MEQYKNILQTAGDKLVVVDFFATWCPPCVQISPTFANFSEKYPDAIFLKVDVDQSADISEDAGIRCMPTFHFIKNGKSIAQIEGADEDLVEENIKQNIIRTVA